MNKELILTLSFLLKIYNYTHVHPWYENVCLNDLVNDFVKLSLTELFPLTAGAPAITLTPPEQSDTYKLHTQLKFQFQVTTLSATLYSGESTLVRRERER